MFCLANPDNKATWPYSEFLRKAKQYNIWNKKLYSSEPNQRDQHLVHNWSDDRSYHGDAVNHLNNRSNVNFSPTTTNSVLEDVCSRSLENDEDRVAIVGNALRFSKRLNIRKDSPIVQPGAYRLSTTLLALILMNGEILLNSVYEGLISAKTFMHHTLRSYLKQCEYKFNAPNFRFQQSIIERYRFRSPIISPRGIETKGYLFKLMSTYYDNRLSAHVNPVRLFSGDREDLLQLSQNPRSRSIPRGKKLNAVATEAIEMVISNLEEIWPGGQTRSFSVRTLGA